MSETNELEVKPVEAQVKSEGQAPEVKDDILSRVEQFMASNKPEESITPETEANNISLADIEAIEDPRARQIALDKYKLLEKGYNKKFQELAEIKKALETNINTRHENWTNEKVQALLNDPDFIQAAQQLVPQTSYDETDDDYSALSDREKALIKKLESQNNMIQQKLSEAEKLQQDARLKSIYNDYDPQAVDTLTADLLNGKVQATREHLYKVVNYDKMRLEMEKKIDAAYKLGRKEERGGIPEKVQAASFQGQQTVPTTNAIVKKEGESSKQFFKRIAAHVVQQTKTTGV